MGLLFGLLTGFSTLFSVNNSLCTHFSNIFSLFSPFFLFAYSRPGACGGLSLSLGGMGHVYHSKRGAEKVIATATVIIVILFVGCSVALLFV